MVVVAVAASDVAGDGGGTDGDASLSSACSSQTSASLVQTILRRLRSYAVRTHRYVFFPSRIRAASTRTVDARILAIFGRSLDKRCIRERNDRRSESYTPRSAAICSDDRANVASERARAARTPALTHSLVHSVKTNPRVRGKGPRERTFPSVRVASRSRHATILRFSR